MSLLEVTMLLCFGVSWPISIFKIVRSKAVAGKSPTFLAIILLGYAAGIAHKLIYSRDWVLALYLLNLCMVSVDLFLYWHYSSGTVEPSVTKTQGSNVDDSSSELPDETEAHERVSVPVARENSMDESGFSTVPVTLKDELEMSGFVADSNRRQSDAPTISVRSNKKYLVSGKWPAQHGSDGKHGETIAKSPRKLRKRA